MEQKWCSWPVLRRSWSPLPSTAGLVASWHSDASFPFSTPYRTSTSLNLTLLNSTQLNSFFDPPRPPFWSPLGHQIDPRSTSSRLLTPYVFKIVNFREMQFRLGETPFCDPQPPPKSTQDQLKTASRRSSKASCFIFVFDIDFGPSWLRCWHHLGSLWGSQIGQSAAQQPALLSPKRP